MFDAVCEEKNPMQSQDFDSVKRMIDQVYGVEKKITKGKKVRTLGNVASTKKEKASGNH